MPASRHFSFHKRLSSANIRQLWQVCAALSKSFGSRKDNTFKASSFGNSEMKSLWNWGSITCIMWRTCVGSHLKFRRLLIVHFVHSVLFYLAISSVSAIILSAFDHLENWASQLDISGGGLSLVGITGQHRLLGVEEPLPPLEVFWVLVGGELGSSLSSGTDFLLGQPFWTSSFLFLC